MMAASTLYVPGEASNFDEVSMQQSLLFSDSLKDCSLDKNFECILMVIVNRGEELYLDLKNLRTQLYSAAEYFEMSYTNDNQRQIVVETLKDYAIKALVNTVDHLGSVSYKVNDLLDKKVDEVSGTEIRVSCIEQRMKTCQEYIDIEGCSQQALVINTPKYHKRYILPVGEKMHGANCTSKFKGCSLDEDDDWHQFRNVVRATMRENPTPTVSKRCSPSPVPEPSKRLGTFSFTSTLPKKQLEKRTISPHRFPLLRSGSLASRSTTPKASRSTTPNSTRPTTPNPTNARRLYPSEPRKSASMRLPAEKETRKDVGHYPSKSIRLLKALLSRHKSKKDDLLYTYLDEY